MRHLVLSLYGVLLFSFIGGCDSAARSGPASTPAPDAARSTEPAIAGLAGDWSGGGKIVVDWIQQKQLVIHIRIATDGSVTGTVGDATLVEAEVRPGRGSIERTLGWSRDFRIHGKLNGDLVAAEDVHRDEVDIVFDRIDQTTLQGGLATSGLEIGPSDVMKVTVGGMLLHKPMSP